MNQFLNRAFENLGDALRDIFEKIRVSNPLLQCPVLSSLIHLDNCYKTGVIDYIVYEWLDKTYDYEKNTDFKALVVRRALDSILNQQEEMFKSFFVHIIHFLIF